MRVSARTEQISPQADSLASFVKVSAVIESGSVSQAWGNCQFRLVMMTIQQGDLSLGQTLRRSAFHATTKT